MVEEIELVDAPERDPNFYARETQRVYKVSDGTAKHTVRVRIDTGTGASGWTYVVENLVAGKWHRLLTGDLEDRRVPFQKAVERAAKVLL